MPNRPVWCPFAAALHFYKRWSYDSEHPWRCESCILRTVLDSTLQHSVPNEMCKRLMRIVCMVWFSSTLRHHKTICESDIIYTTCHKYFAVYVFYPIFEGERTVLLLDLLCMRYSMDSIVWYDIYVPYHMYFRLLPPLDTRYINIHIHFRFDDICDLRHFDIHVNL